MACPVRETAGETRAGEGLMDEEGVKIDLGARKHADTGTDAREELEKRRKHWPESTRKA